jgi:hypothetical protein
MSTLDEELENVIAANRSGDFATIDTFLSHAGYAKVPGGFIDPYYLRSTPDGLDVFRTVRRIHHYYHFTPEHEPTAREYFRNRARASTSWISIGLFGGGMLPVFIAALNIHPEYLTPALRTITESAYDNIPAILCASLAILAIGATQRYISDPWKGRKTRALGQYSENDQALRDAVRHPPT